MDESEGNSEVARTMHQIDLELEAADRALHGFAITARHDFITARMQRQGEHILQLIDAGRHAEALALMNTDDWSGNREQTTKRQRRAHPQKEGQEERKVRLRP